LGFFAETRSFLPPLRCSINGAVLLFTAYWSSVAGTETLDQLYALASAEKAVVLWAAASTAIYERAVRAFEQQFPGFTVSLTGGFSNVLNARIARN
jgi:ABC-type glycerol-3-phosphate transport system substrate-binding protein